MSKLPSKNPFEGLFDAQGESVKSNVINSGTTQNPFEGLFETKTQPVKNAMVVQNPIAEQKKTTTTTFGLPESSLSAVKKGTVKWKAPLTAMEKEKAYEKTPVFEQKSVDFVYNELKNDPSQTGGFLGTFKNTFLPTKAIQSGNSAIVNKALDKINAEYQQEHPVLSIVSQTLGTLANLFLLRQVGAGFGLAEKTTKAAGGLSRLAPTATRIIGSGLESGSIFGIESLATEALNQVKAKQAKPVKLFTETAKGFGTGLALGAAGSLKTLPQRVVAGGVTMGGLSTLEALIQDGKIDSKDLVNIGVNTLIGAGFELIGGTKKTEMFKKGEMQSIAQEHTIQRILSNHPEMPRADAEKWTKILGELDFVTKSGIYQTATPEMMKQYQGIPEDFFAQPKEVKSKYFSNVSNEVINGKTFEEAIKITNEKMGFKVSLIDNFNKTKEQVSTPVGQQDEVLIQKYGEVTEAVKSYQEANKENVVSVQLPGAETPIATIDVVKNDDSKWAYSIDVNTTDKGLVSDFLSNKLSTTKEQAISSAKEDLLTYIRTEIENVSAETQSQFEYIKNRLEAPEEQIMERIRKTGKYSVEDVTPKEYAPAKAPRFAKTKEGLVLEAEKPKPTGEKGAEVVVRNVGAIEKGVEREIKGEKVVVPQKPIFSRTKFLELAKNTPEFAKNPVFTVIEKPIGDPESTPVKLLSFEGKERSFNIRPSALGLVEANLEVGQKVTVNVESLKAPKTELRVNEYKGGVGRAYGFNPKNLEDLEKPIATVETDKIIKRSEIAKQLSEKLGVPIRRGKFNRQALGIFKPHEKVIRLKRGGLNTIFHEAAHFLDDKFALSKVIDKKEREALLVEYGFLYTGQPIRQRSEAFAEFVRFMMTGQEQRAESLAPNFYDIYKKEMRKLPEILDVLNTARDDYIRWKQQPATAKVLSQISLGTENKESLLNRTTSNIHNLYTMGKDDLHPLAEFSTLAKNKGVKLPAQENPYILARNSRGWIGKADTFLNKGTFGREYWKVENGKIKPFFKGKSFSDIIKPLAEKIDDFRVYLTAQRVLELAERKITTGISAEDAKEAVNELIKINPEFEQAAKDLYKYQDDVLEYAYEMGLIGAEGLKKIREVNKFRVPFYRVMEETNSHFMGGRKLAGNLGRQIKKIKGSEREIIDPLESIIKDTYAIINASERNNIGIAMANLSQKDFELGRLFEEVDPKMQATTVNVGEILKKATPEVADQIPEELFNEVVTMFRPTQDRGSNMLNVNFGDKQRVFQVEPTLFKALQGLEIEDVGMIMRVLAMPARLLRAGATLSPDFSIRNPLRDQFSAFIYSKYGFIPGVDLIKGLFEVFKKGDVYDLWKMGGGEHSMLVSLDREALQKNFQDIVRTKGGMFFKYVKHPVELLRVISELGEEATRLGEMKRALDSMANPIEGAFASREVTLDFARIGSKTRAINSIIAFWNANLEGLDRMARSFKDKPFRTLWKVLLGITLPSILLYFANRKDPRWKEIPSWQKDLFWIVMTKNHIYRIPKPFELGILFGSVPERILEYLDTKDKDLFKELENSVVNGATPGFIPTTLAPIIENITNYSFFLNRPIVSEGKQNLPPQAQYGTYTSEVAKLAGKVLNYSPAKIDNLIQGYTGGLGKYAVSALDKIMTKTGLVNVPSTPAKGLEDMPVIKSFMIRKPVGTSSESVNRIYNLYAETSAGASFVKKLLEQGEIDTAKQYVADNPKLVYSKIVQDTVTVFGKINKARDEIRYSRTLTAKQKKDNILKLDNLETDIAQKLLKELEDGKN